MSVRDQHADRFQCPRWSGSAAVVTGIQSRDTAFFRPMQRPLAFSSFVHRALWKDNYVRQTSGIIPDQIGISSLLEASNLVKMMEGAFGVPPLLRCCCRSGYRWWRCCRPLKSRLSSPWFWLSAGSNRSNVIKVVREITGLGLKETKDLVDGAQKPLKEGVARKAEEIRRSSPEAGATIELKVVV